MKKLFLGILLFFLNSNIFSQNRLEVSLGGALRFNYKYQDWDISNKKQLGSIAYDMFRINADASYRNVLMHAEYRFYSKSSGGGMLKSGWLGYKFNPSHELRLGLTSVPFGLQPYTSNSYFFNINYYLGLEDDDDMGITYKFTSNNWILGVGFFKNSDLLNGDGSEISPERYSYDIAGRNKETNTIAVQSSYKLDGLIQNEFGTSFLGGQIYNLDTNKLGLRWAYALHYKAKYRNFELMSQFTQYQVNTKNENRSDVRTIKLAAFGSSCNASSKGATISACLSYTCTLKRKWIDSIKFYNDFSMLHKSYSDQSDSFQNISGCQIVGGPVIAYFDIASGKNHSWLGGDWENAFAVGSHNATWHTRINLNFGYYF